MDLISNILIFTMTLGLPLLALELNRWMASAYAGEEFSQIPVFWRASLIGGCTLGVLVFLQLVPPHDRTMDAVMSVSGPWNLTLWELFDSRIFGLGVPGESVKFHMTLQFRGLSLALLMVLALVTVGLVTSGYGYLCRERINRVLAVCTIYLLVTAFLTWYLICMALWVIHSLNFWIILLVLLLLRWPLNWPGNLRPKH